jgi:flagellar motility protein MotE (MotC chaperone)
MRTRHLGLLIFAILVISTAPLYARRQQQNVAKLKEDARNAVGIIGADRGKTHTYCQIVDLLGRQLEQADQKKDKKEIKATSQRVNQLQKKLGPEFAVLENILKNIDLKSADGREIASIIQSLNESCPE